MDTTTKKKKHVSGVTVVSYIVLALLSLSAILPFVLMFTSSISSEESITRNGYSFIPSEFSLAAYEYLWGNRTIIGRAYLTTIVIAVMGTAISLAITLMLAYTLSRENLPGRKVLNFLVLFTMLFNGGLVATYLVYTEVFHIKNTYWALLIPGLLMNAFNVMLARNFFSNSIPKPLIEAALIDGATEFQVFRRIVIPISLPIIATLGMFIFMAYWNDWNNGLYYLTDTRYYNIQNVLNDMLANIQFLKNNSEISGEMMAAVSNLPTSGVRMAIASAVAIPVLAVFPCFERYFVKGIFIFVVKE